MLLDLSRLKRGVERVDRTFDPASFGTFEEFRVAAPVVVAGEAHKDAQKVRLVGTVTTALEVACSRCLEPYALPVNARLDLMFLPAPEPVAGKPGKVVAGDAEDDEDAGTEIADEDVGVAFYANETIDLGAVVREQFYLALPMKPLCRPDCAGLCVVCGGNRNVEKCSCEAKWIDPRLAPLKKLME